VVLLMLGWNPKRFKKSCKESLIERWELEN
jgi:hypothetical protein